ncbi:MAG: DUF4404 family protein [Pseudomonadota bacterium]
MKKVQLREILEQLHTELEQTKSVDKTSRELLRDVIKDIYDVLERSSKKPSGGHQSLINQLTEAASRFEETHRTLAATVGQVIDALGRMGI